MLFLAAVFVLTVPCTLLLFVFFGPLVFLFLVMFLLFFPSFLLLFLLSFFLLFLFPILLEGFGLVSRTFLGIW